MEAIKLLAVSSFDSFINLEYKNAISTLNKLRSHESLKKKFVNRVIHNTHLCEYLQNRAGYQNTFLSKIDEIIESLRGMLPAEKEAPQKNQENDDCQYLTWDESTIRYNFAVVLFLSGKAAKSLEVLKELFYNKNGLVDFKLIKTCFLLLELGFLYKQTDVIQDVLNFLDDDDAVKTLFPRPGSEGEFNKASEVGRSLDGSSDNAVKISKPQGSQSLIPSIFSTYNISSIIYGSEIHRHGESPMNLNAGEFHFILNIYKILFLINFHDEQETARSQLKLTKTKLIKFLAGVRQVSEKTDSQKDSYVPGTNAFLLKYTCFILKFVKAQLACAEKNFSKSLFLMSPSYNPDPERNPATETSALNNMFQIFQMNNTGVVHIKMSKPKLGVYYFKKALNSNYKAGQNSVSQKQENLTSLNINQKIPFVIYNLGLALAQARKTKEACEVLSSISDNFPNQMMIWYRLGTLYTIRYDELMKEGSEKVGNDIYTNILDNHQPRFINEHEGIQRSGLKENAKKGGKKDEKGVAGVQAQPPNPSTEIQDHFYFKRFSLNPKETRKTKIEEDPEQQGKLGDSDQTDFGRTLDNCLEMAAKCLRNCIFNIKIGGGTKEKEYSVKFYKEAVDVQGEEYKENERIEEKIKSSREIALEQEIHQSALAHLAYVYICSSEFNNAILTATEALNLSFTSEENKFKCTMYQVEAYTGLGKFKEAQKLLNNSPFFAGVAQSNLKIPCRNTLGQNYSQYSDIVNSRMILYANMAYLNLLNQQYQVDKTQAEKSPAEANLFSASQCAETKENMGPSIPLPLLNLMIYNNLIKNNYSDALQLIKRRRLLSNQTTNGNQRLLKITK